jgi:hypothetical protein
MSKNLQNLERLCQKMQARYGPNDPMVLQLLDELAAKKQLTPIAAQWVGNHERRTAKNPRVHLRAH